MARGIDGPVRTKKPLSDDEWEWQLASFKWLITEFGGIKDNPDNKLVLPTPDFFPPTSSDPAQKAQQGFDQVKQLSGLGEWPTKLVEGEKSREMAVGSNHALKHESHAPAGDYQLMKSDGGEYFALIRYNPKNLDDPSKLIATFAHELSHYLMSTAKTAPPGGWEIHELTTDLCSAYLGFGIFMAMSAWNFEGSNEGWQYERQGYLNEPMLVTALAIWETLARRDPLKALPYLKSHMAKDLKNAAKYIQKLDLAAEVMSIDLSLFEVEDETEAKSS